MEPTIAQLAEKMIRFSVGNTHDIDHFLRVWSYARIIGALEGLDTGTQYILEAAAIVHDIACPLCREKYGHADGKLQEREGGPLVRRFLAGSGLDASVIDRIAFLVGHHHTFTGIDGLDYQILIEADYIANATENGYSKKAVETFCGHLCKTDAGKRLLRSVFCL